MSTYDNPEGGAPGATAMGAQQHMGGAPGNQGGGGFGNQYIGYGQRPWAETKPFLFTSEFLTLIGTLAAIAIAMAVLDNFDAPRGWTLITVVASAYIVSRGIAKAGSRDPNPDRGANRY
jgi:hypothetical protein